MKHVFQNHTEVCKAWAKQVPADHGRSGNIEYSELTLYSYGHYPIAKLYPKRKVCLIQSETYSVSTSKHISLASRAAENKDYLVFHVPFLETNDIKENRKYFLHEAKKDYESFFRAKTHGRYYLNSNNTFITLLKQYCKAFKIHCLKYDSVFLNPESPEIKRRFLKLENREIFLPLSISKIGWENIQIKHIFKTRNVEVRREIIAKFGIENVMKELNAVTLDKQENYELIMLHLRDGKIHKYLKMKNPSVSDTWHIEGIHPACSTVIEAINYRRFGGLIFSDMPWNERQFFHSHPEKRIIQEQYKVAQWQPTQLT
jgi:hypothetical protein